ncbi:hypothetical protein SGLAM104S_06742 [Streptomyces glaucescens]
MNNTGVRTNMKRRHVRAVAVVVGVVVALTGARHSSGGGCGSSGSAGPSDRLRRQHERQPLRRR